MRFSPGIYEHAAACIGRSPWEVSRDAALRHLLAGQKAYLDAIRLAGLGAIVFESGTCPPLLPVDAFKTIEAPLLTDFLAYGRSLFGEALPCIVGGDARPSHAPSLRPAPVTSSPPPRPTRPPSSKPPATSPKCTSESISPPPSCSTAP